MVFLVNGCAIQRNGSQRVSQYLGERTSSQSDVAGDYSQIPPARSGENPQETKEPVVQQTRPCERLRDFILLALKCNPDIKAAEETARAQVEQIQQLTSLPDPLLYMKILPEPLRTAEGDNYFILGVSQKLPVPQKLDRAGQVA